MRADAEWDDIEDPNPPRHEPNVPERALWCAVLEQAVADARGLRETTQPHSDTWQNQADARAWFKSKSIAVGSFRWVLAQLGIVQSASKIRNAAMCGRAVRRRYRGRVR